MKLILEFLYISIYHNISSLLIYVYELYILHDSSWNSYFLTNLFFVWLESIVEIRTRVDLTANKYRRKYKIQRKNGD